MKLLYAPWRNKYVDTIEKGKMENSSKEDCVFCAIIKDHDDKKHFVFRRFTHHVIMLNTYPYNAGHLLIVSLEHVKDLKDVSPEARHELIDLTNESIKILTSAMKAEGINVGINLGKTAGAGIPSHFHQHILPRWPGDTNFLPLLAETKQISVDLIAIYKMLKPHFDNLAL